MADGTITNTPSVAISETTRRDVLVRLRRIEGQIRGIQRMIDENRDCRDVVVQLAAVKSAIGSLNTLVAETYAHECLSCGDQLGAEAVTGLLDLLKAAR